MRNRVGASLLILVFWTIGFSHCYEDLPENSSLKHRKNGDVDIIKKKKEALSVSLERLLHDQNTSNTPKQIPLHLLMQLKDISSLDELFEKMIEPSQRYKRRGLKSTKEFTKKRNKKNRKMARGGGLGGKALSNNNNNNNDTSAIMNLADDDVGGGGGGGSGGDINPVFDKRAFCQPRRQPVDIPQPKDSTLIYQPPCLQIERCGGCCSHELFQCVASSKKNVTRKVAALRYPHAEAEYFVLESLVKVRVERHTKCQCQCKVQPEDCSVRQMYDRENCRCVCSQVDGHTKCKEPQIWIEKECRCRCPEYSECSSGTYFDTRMCRCRVPGEILAQGKMLRLMSKSLYH